MKLKRLQQSLDEINEFGYSIEGVTRLAYTNIEQQALQFLMEQFEKENMTVKVDAVGNVIARRDGTDPALPAVACGSHIDTVYNAGQFDGTAGVIAGLEVIRSLNEQEIKTKHPIEIIIFACEESARFRVATIGSKIMTGLDEKEKLKRLVDKNGISLNEALEMFGYDLNRAKEAKRGANEIKMFLELHIEQGPVLESEEKQIGIVTGIAAPTRFKLQVNGQAAHSGSTPMDHRQDAFSGTAEIALALEDSARKEAKHGTVATVGNCRIKNGAMNVVPGETEMIIDIRGILESSKNKVVEDLYRVIADVESKRNLQIEITKFCDEQPTTMNQNVIKLLKESCEKLDISYIEMISGAGHDAMNMANVYPTGMIFVPSKDGLSHNKDEYTSIEQLFIGATLLKEGILTAAEVTNKAYC